MTERWLPASESELAAAIEDGRLDEGAHLDFKASLRPGRSGNVELARDIAMFANDGGTLVVGVAEPEAGRFQLSPGELDGLRERVEQVASSRLDPPLHVGVATIRTDADPSMGYLLVSVPASPSAPHMTDDRYYGRVGSTREVLSDSQVRSILSQRKARLRPILDLLEEDVDRDPIPAALRSHGHLHVVARPRFAREDLVLHDVERIGGGWHSWIHKELMGPEGRRGRGRWAPDLLSQANTVGHRARGAALYSRYVGQDRSLSGIVDEPEELLHRETDLLDLEVDEDGTLHMYCGRGTDTFRETEVLMPGIVVGLTMRVVDAAAQITRLTNYIGTWDFAVGMTGIQGVVTYSGRGVLASSSVAYSADAYRQATAAATSELLSDPEAVGSRLMGRLLRGLGQNDDLSLVLSG